MLRQHHYCLRHALLAPVPTKLPPPFAPDPFAPDASSALDGVRETCNNGVSLARQYGTLFTRMWILQGVTEQPLNLDLAFLQWPEVHSV